MYKKVVNGLIYILLCTAALIRCFWGLGDEPLARWDEQTNADVVREFISHRDVYHLTLRGEPFLEKPPIWYYFTAVVVSRFGFSTFALRFVSGIFGLALILIIWLTTHRWYGRSAGIISVLLLLTTDQLFVTNPGGVFSTHHIRSADVDILMIFFMFLSSVAYWWNGKIDATGVYLGTILTTLGFLTKGPLSYVPTVVYILYIGIFTDKGKFYSLVIRICIILCIFLGTYIGINIWIYGDIFVSQYLQYHLLNRVLQPLEGHSESILFYILLLFDKRINFWFEVYLTSIIIYITIVNTLLRDYKYFMPVISSFMILAIITITQTKLAWYVLPLYPYAALTIAGCINQVKNISVLKYRLIS